MRDVVVSKMNLVFGKTSGDSSDVEDVKQLQEQIATLRVQLDREKK